MKKIITFSCIAIFLGIIMAITHTMYELSGIVFFGGIAVGTTCVLLLEKPRGPYGLFLNIISLFIASITSTVTVILAITKGMRLRVTDFEAQLLFGFILFFLLILRAKNSIKKPSY